MSEIFGRFQVLIFFGPQMTPSLPTLNASPGRKSQQLLTTQEWK